MNLDWTWVSVVAIYIISAVLKRQADGGAAFKAKYIPIIQIVLAVMVQIVAGIMDTIPNPVARLVTALAQAGIPQLVYQLPHQLKKEE